MSFSIQSLYTWYRNTLRNPKYRWWIILGTLAYLLSPIDIAPDFLPIVGQLDDLTLLTLLIAEVSQILTERVKARPQAQSKSASSEEEATVDVKAVSAD
jgi:uncharacterized membrane protein YkvA (DUF1232 family)